MLVGRGPPRRGGAGRAWQGTCPDGNKCWPLVSTWRHDVHRRRPLVHRSPGPRAAAGPGADGGRAGRGAGDGGVGRRRAGIAAGRGDVVAGLARRRRRDAARRRPAGQHQLLLPRGAPARPVARGRLARDAAAVLRRARRVDVGDPVRPRPAAVRRRGGRRRRGLATRGRQLPLRPATRAAARARAARGRAGLVVGDDRGRGALARGARRRRHHRAGRRGRRPSGRVPA